MNTNHLPSDVNASFAQLDSSSATRLLKLGISGPKRRVDPLIERLRSTAGKAWFAGMLKRPPFAGLREPVEQLVQGRASLDEIVAFKDAGKQAVTTAPGADAELTGVAAYYLAIAAAMAHHNSLISSVNRPELDAVLLDLAEVLPSPWSELASRAALVKSI